MGIMMDAGHGECKHHHEEEIEDEEDDDIEGEDDM